MRRECDTCIGGELVAETFELVSKHRHIPVFVRCGECGGTSEALDNLGEANDWADDHRCGEDEA